MAEPIDLVLSGGGVLGVGHAGAVSVLEKRGHEFKRIAGTSAGSIVGALLAAGKDASELRELIGGLKYPGGLILDYFHGEGLGVDGGRLELRGHALHVLDRAVVEEDRPERLPLVD